MEERIRDFLETYCQLCIGHPTNQDTVETRMVYHDVQLKQNSFTELHGEQLREVVWKMLDIPKLEGTDTLSDEFKMLFVQERNKFVKKVRNLK